MSRIIYGIEKGVFIVDKENYEWLNKYKWRDHPDGYAQAYINGTVISMHRLIMGDPKGEMIDHINGLVNDNRKVNLRLSNASLNQANKRKSKNKSTEFKGVVARTHGYEASIAKDGKHYYIGMFTKKESAANAYNYYAQKKFGEHARLNQVEFQDISEWSASKTERKLLSDYLGVHKVRDGHWRVRFVVEGKERIFGCYTEEDVAANVYNHYIKMFRGEHTLLNDVEHIPVEECEGYSVSYYKSTSKYMGVSRTRANRWRVRTYHDGRERVISHHDSELEAARAYNNYILNSSLERALNILPDMVGGLKVIVYYSKNCRIADIVKSFLYSEGVLFEEVSSREFSKVETHIKDLSGNIVFRTKDFNPRDLIEIRKSINLSKS